MTETDWLSAICSGDRPALARMYRALFPAIRSLVRERGGSDADAQDLFQDGVVVVYEKARRPGFVLTSRFSTFFYGICLNLQRSRSQRKSNSEVSIPEDAKYMVDESVEVDWLRVERGKLFASAFRRLGGDCQKLLQLFFQKMPMDEIAREMGYAGEGYAARRKYLCKNQLVELVKSDPAFPELQNN